MKSIIKSIIYHLLLIKAILLIKYLKIKNYDNICLLISNGLNLTGAPLVLLETAKIYKKNGYKVLILSETFGPLIKEYNKEKINTVIINGNKTKIINELLTINFSFIIVNTIVMYKYINKLNYLNIPTIWWLHEGTTYINQYKNLIPRRLSKNITVLGVSNIVKEALVKYKCNYNIKILNYGIKDFYKVNSNKKMGKNKIKIAVIGTIYERKNQIFAIETFKKLPKNIKNKVDLIFLGKPNCIKDKYYLKFMNLINTDKRIKYIKMVEHKNMYNFFQTIDIILCCSTDDPLPVVITEGLLLKKLVIVNSNVGQYSIIENNINGYKYKADSQEELINTIIQIINSKHSWENVQNNARLLYQKFFSLTAFEVNLLNYTNSILHK